ncbi:MAG: aconitate hydratase, partial [Clostridiales bacterium]|nr:aconitate hydratase [Clostridiales bacterium]
ETAAASAISGVLTDARTLGGEIMVDMPESFLINDNMVEMPASAAEAKDVEVIYGPNIKPFPSSDILPESITAKTVLKVGDDITTDHIMPAGAKILPYRSNIPYLSQFCFRQCDENFAENCKAAGSGIIVGGSNYGQGSSREHAALVPLYLGIKAVIVKSFARIHRANLINAGILPFTFADASDYDKISKDDLLELPDLRKALSGATEIKLVNKTKNEEYSLLCPLSDRQLKIILAGGLLNYTKLGE